MNENRSNTSEFKDSIMMDDNSFGKKLNGDINSKKTSDSMESP